MDLLKVLLLLMFPNNRLAGLLFPKEFVREKSDSQMQGDQYVIGALNVDATIRAYQVSIPSRDSCMPLHSPTSTCIPFIRSKDTWPLDSRHRSVGHTESGVGEVAGHREFSTSNRGAASSQGNNGGGHEQGIPPLSLDRYRGR